VARSFLDTNVFFYAIDGADPIKQGKARTLIESLASSGEGVVSTQVIQEFANNAIRKLRIAPEQTIILCEAFADHAVVKPDADLVRNALRLMQLASISFWDACNLAAAELGGCKVLYTEDLNSGQRINGIRVVNPFI
jgi:predicted nucleic acid-binding protein